MPGDAGVEFQASSGLLGSWRYKVFKMGTSGLGCYRDEAALWGSFHPTIALAAHSGRYWSFWGGSNEHHMAYLLLHNFHPPCRCEVRGLLGFQEFTIRKKCKCAFPIVWRWPENAQLWQVAVLLDNI
jgi:hypothetical protein